MSDISKYVIYPDWLEDALPRENYEYILKLSQLGWKIYPVSFINKDKRLLQSILKSKSIIFAYTYEELNISILKSNNTRLIYKIVDICDNTNYNMKVCIDSCDYIYGTYNYLFKTIDNISLNNKPQICIPHSAVPSFYLNLPFNNNPKNKIFVSGATSWHYPLRCLISTDPIYKDMIEKLEHPGYIQQKKVSHDIVKDKYYAKLNEYLCCFCDCLVYKYLIAKVFEITSVGSLLLVEDSIVEQLNDLGFFHMTNCIMFNKENMYERVCWIINDKNRDEVDSIRNRGMELTRKNHTIDKRIETFTNYVDNVIAVTL